MTMERVEQVQAFQVEYDCDACGERTRATGNARTDSPMQYENACKNGHRMWSEKAYPHITYKQVVLKEPTQD